MTNVCKLMKACDEAGCDEQVPPGVGTRCGGDDPCLGCRHYFCDEHLICNVDAFVTPGRMSRTDAQFLCTRCYVKIHPESVYE